MHYSEDSLTVKFLVAAIWILDTLQVLSDIQLWRSRKFELFCLVFTNGASGECVCGCCSSMLLFTTNILSG